LAKFAPFWIKLDSFRACRLRKSNTKGWRWLGWLAAPVNADDRDSTSLALATVRCGGITVDTSWAFRRSSTGEQGGAGENVPGGATNRQLPIDGAKAALSLSLLDPLFKFNRGRPARLGCFAWSCRIRQPGHPSTRRRDARRAQGHDGHSSAGILTRRTTPCMHAGCRGGSAQWDPSLVLSSPCNACAQRQTIQFLLKKKDDSIQTNATTYGTTASGGPGLCGLWSLERACMTHHTLWIRAAALRLFFLSSSFGVCFLLKY
jgi:hypothetical protein